MIKARFSSILPSLWFLAATLGAAQTQTPLFKDDFESATLGTNWKADPQCKITEDPTNPQNHVLLLDAHGAIPVCKLIAQLPDEFVLDFRARYHTDYPGMATGGKPDGAHTPNWDVLLGGKLGMEESYIWDGVLLNGDGPVIRTEGAHAPDKWFHYQIARSKSRIQVFVDGVPLLDHDLKQEQPSSIGFRAQDEDLWIDDVTVTPWHELTVAVDNHITDPDIPINEDFANGASSLWKSAGGWKIVDDPDQPGHKVLYSAPEHRDATLTTLASNFKNYTLEMRVRIQADHGTYPHNDGFFGFWGIDIRKSPQATLTFSDDYVWGHQGFLFKDKGYGGDARHIKMGQWYDFKVVSSEDHFQVYIDGTSIGQAEIPNVPPGKVSIHVMDERIWLQSLKLTFHPEALLYDTFADGISPERWIANADWTVAGKESGNQYAVCPANAATPLLSKLSFTDGVLLFKTRLQNVGAEYPWTVLVRQKAESSLALRYDAKSHEVQLGQAAGNEFKVIQQASVPPPEKDTWTSYRVVLANGHCIVLQDTATLFTAPTESMSGPIGLISPSGGADFDDVLVAPVPKPTFDLQPLQTYGIYLPQEEKGAVLSVVNDDVLPHQITGTLTLETPQGEVISTSPISQEIKGGEKLGDIKLAVAESKPGDYMVHVVLKSDGEPLTDWKHETLILPEAPVFAGNYRSKLAVCGGINQPDALVKLGVQRARGGVYEGVKKSDGTWDFSKTDAVVADLRAHHIRMSALYMDVNTGWTQKGIDTTAETYGSVAKHFAGPEDILFTIWNEPNHGGFWVGSPNSPLDYMAIVKASYNAIKDADPNAPVAIGELSSPDVKFMKGIMDNRGGDYTDEITYHPYGYPKKPEDLIPQACANIKAVIDEYGGWFDHEITEHGYPTSTSGNGVPEDIQAYFHVRTQLIANGIDYLRSLHIYCFNDGGVNSADNEARFGLIRHDGTPKPSYRALAIMARALANTNYAGRLTTDPGSYVQVYRRYDGKIVLAAWAIQDSDISLKVGNGPVTLTGFFGDVTSLTPENGELKLKLTKGPVYLTGDSLDSSLIFRAAANWNQEKTDFITDRLGKLQDGGLKASLTTEFHAIADPVTTMLSQGGTGASADSLKKSLDSLFTWAGRVIDLGKSGKLTRDEAGIVTEGVYRYFVALECPLMVLDPSAKPDSGAAAALATATSAMQTKTGPLGSQPLVQRMIHFGQEHLQTASSLASIDPANSAVESYLAAKIGEMAQAFVAVDPVIYRKTVFNVLPKYIETGIGDRPKVTSTFSNGQGVPFDAQVQISFPSDWDMAPLQISQTVAPGDTWTGHFDLSLPATIKGGVYMLTAQSKIGDKLFDSYPIRVTVEAPAEFYAGPLAGVPDHDQPFVMTVVNSLSQPLHGSLKLTGSDGMPLVTALGSTDKISIGPKQTQKLSFILGPQKHVDFNEYPVHATLTDDSGKVLADEIVPLDFPLTAYTARAVPMDGSLDVWKTAFPNHLRVGSKGLDPKKLSATVYSLYDDTNYYFLVRVNDEIQNQTHIGTDLWQGDSIQVSFDPKHEKTGGAYGPNDIELGFALASDSNKLLSVTYVSPVKNMMDKIHFNVIRDETQKTTTYVVAIPFDQLNGMTSKVGLVYGFNACVQDADRSFGREHSLELTEGTNAKDPSKYYDWVLLKKN